jgi:hypothetical protein
MLAHLLLQTLQHARLRPTAAQRLLDRIVGDPQALVQQQEMGMGRRPIAGG